MVKSILLALVLSATLVYGQTKPPADRHYQAFRPYKNMVEKGGYNRGPFIDTCNRRYAYLKAPYCASCLSEILRRLGVKVPSVRSARARDFITDKSIDARKVWKGQAQIPVPCIGVFTRKGGGHVCWIWKVVGDTLYCRDFNSTPDGMTGSFYDGTWSGEKKRSIKKHCSPFNTSRLTHFTGVEF